MTSKQADGWMEEWTYNGNEKTNRRKNERDVSGY